MPLAIVPQADKDAAQKIAAAAEAGYNRMRDRTDLSMEGIRRGIAAVYTAAKPKMEALEQRSSGSAAQRLRDLTAAAWGIDDIAGTNAVDRAAASMSFRDAVDRAAKLNNPNELAAALKQAESNGDELAARAHAQRAYDLRMLDIVQAYIDPRPKAGEAIAALLDLESHAPQITDMWAFLLPQPPELFGLQDYEIAALAAAPASA